MKILGIDPGKTTGWLIYDSVERRAVSSGDFLYDLYDGPTEGFEVVVIERARGYGPSWPDVVEAAWFGGRLFSVLEVDGHPVFAMERKEICSILSDNSFGIRVKNDATAWAALVQMHGEGCDKKPRVKKGVVVEQGGALGTVKGSHQKAALAAAVAYALREGQ